jgi:F-type H+-transporting ATPase subunit a
MAIMSIVLILFAGIRFKGIKGWLKSFIEPVPFLLPFKILEYGIKPLSLCLRLFGNILAAFIIMELVYFAFPMIVPGVLSIYFDLFDGILQAYVFVFLTSLFIGEAVEEE